MKKSKSLKPGNYWHRGGILGFKIGLAVGVILLLVSLSGHSQITPVLAYSIFYPYFIGVFYVAPWITDPLCTEWCFHLIPLFILISGIVGVGIYTILGILIGFIVDKINKKRKN